MDRYYNLSGLNRYFIAISVILLSIPWIGASEPLNLEIIIQSAVFFLVSFAVLYMGLSQLKNYIKFKTSDVAVWSVRGSEEKLLSPITAEECEAYQYDVSGSGINPRVMNKAGKGSKGRLLLLNSHGDRKNIHVSELEFQDGWEFSETYRIGDEPEMIEEFLDRTDSIQEGSKANILLRIMRLGMVNRIRRYRENRIKAGQKIYELKGDKGLEKAVRDPNHWKEKQRNEGLLKLAAGALIGLPLYLIYVLLVIA